jgi:hypothetical protein
MASIGKRTIVKELERRTKPAGISKNPAAKLALAASERSRPKLKATRLKKNVHSTEDEADILISMRREKERRVSLAEVLRKHGYGLEGRVCGILGA